MTTMPDRITGGATPTSTCTWPPRLTPADCWASSRSPPTQQATAVSQLAGQLRTHRAGWCRGHRQLRRRADPPPPVQGRPGRGGRPPQPPERRRAGKSDPLDAIEAARAAQSGRARGAARTETATWRPSACCAWLARAPARTVCAPSTSLAGRSRSSPAVPTESLSSPHPGAGVTGSAPDTLSAQSGGAGEIWRPDCKSVSQSLVSLRWGWWPCCCWCCDHSYRPRGWHTDVRDWSVDPRRWEHSFRPFHA